MAKRLNLTPAPVTVAVRTGDTPSGARSAMVKDPPTILVTTPESLYLYLTAERSRATLTSVRTVIVDEIHALARDKRGSHLTLSLERLEHVQQGRRPQRVGLSATQRPIEVTARILSGAGATLASGPLRSGRPRPSRPRPCRPRPCCPRPCCPRSPVQPSHGPRAFRLARRSPRRNSRLRPPPRPTGEHGAAGRRAGRRPIPGATRRDRPTHRRPREGPPHNPGVREHPPAFRTPGPPPGRDAAPDQVAAHHGSLSADRRKRTESRLRAGRPACLGRDGVP